MDTGTRVVSGDDVCSIICPSGPRPGCVKEICYEIYLHFAKDIAPPPKKAKKNKAGVNNAKR
jgi:hypothetical protein